MEPIGKMYIRWSEDCVWHSSGNSITIAKFPNPQPGLIQEEEKILGMKLNEVGRDIWDLCDGTRTLDGIVNQLLKEYEGDPVKIREGVEKTILNLEEKRFLTYEETVKEYEQIELSPQEYLAWNDNTIWNEVEGHVVIMNNITGMSFDFPEELGESWKLCDGTKSVKEIFTTLEEEGIINEGVPASGFYLLFKQLIKLGHLTLRREPAP
jgi:hypothetical protein